MAKVNKYYEASIFIQLYTKFLAYTSLKRNLKSLQAADYLKQKLSYI